MIKKKKLNKNETGCFLQKGSKTAINLNQKQSLK